MRVPGNLGEREGRTGATEQAGRVIFDAPMFPPRFP